MVRESISRSFDKNYRQQGMLRIGENILPKEESPDWLTNPVVRNHVHVSNIETDNKFIYLGLYNLN